MTIITLVAAILLLALALWVLSIVTIDAQIKRILYVVIVVVFALWLLSAMFGNNIGDIRIS